MIKKIIDPDWCLNNANKCPKCESSKLYAISKDIAAHTAAVWIECECGHTGDIGDNEKIQTLKGNEPWAHSDAFSLWQKQTNPTQEIAL